MSVWGFIVHAYPDFARDRIYCVGRLADGRSFAAVEEKWRPCIHVFAEDFERARSLFARLDCAEIPCSLESFCGTRTLKALRFSRYRDHRAAAKLLADAGIQSPDSGAKPAELFLSEKNIRGPAILDGDFSPGKRLGAVIRRPEIYPPEQTQAVSLRVASVDIETDTQTGVIRAVSVAWTDRLYGETAQPGVDGTDGANGGIARVLRAAPPAGTEADSAPLFFHDTEESLLRAFIDDINRVDPDVLTGWNFIDFDFPRIAQRCEIAGIPFTLGRSSEPAKFLPGDAPSGGWHWRRRSAAAIVPGRQVLDALRITRTGTWGGAGDLRLSWSDDSVSDFSLETVSQAVLGEGKTVHSSGEEKIAELDKLYSEDKQRFGEYCLRDAELVLRILDKTGLFRLTVERASLTGVSLDKAWTNVVSFERVYGMELRHQGIAPPVPGQDTNVSGAAGGTVLDPMPGLFSNVAVFDFRSLYPTIMLTFNIDPLAHARAEPHNTHDGKKEKDNEKDKTPPIIAPNGAAFSRERGLLPGLIADYFAARRRAIKAGDSIASQVYKILMNSFYGVLGSGACRYGRTELAGAITSFARKWLLFSRDWFAGQGFRVLYGDTDSLFVETGFGDNTAYTSFSQRCEELAAKLNQIISEKIHNEYDLKSHIELRFEKAQTANPPERAGEGQKATPASSFAITTHQTQKTKTPSKSKAWKPSAATQHHSPAASNSNSWNLFFQAAPKNNSSKKSKPP